MRINFSQTKMIIRLLSSLFLDSMRPLKNKLITNESYKILGNNFKLMYR